MFLQDSIPGKLGKGKLNAVMGIECFLKSAA